MYSKKYSTVFNESRNLNTHIAIKEWDINFHLKALLVFQLEKAEGLDHTSVALGLPR